VRASGVADFYDFLVGRGASVPPRPPEQDPPGAA
jgi:hypothetical protein